MAHARQQIREAAVAVLAGSATASAVYDSRRYPFDTLPCLAVYALGDQRVEDESTASKEYRLVDLAVEARAKATTGVEDTLDQLCAETEDLLATNESLSVGVKSIEYVDTEIDLEADQEKPTGVARMRFAVLYRVDLTDPETIIA